MPGPPGDVPIVLAVGHEFQLGTYLGPPLAFWLAELAFVLAGNSLFGVYLLSQVCVVVTYWAVFALGRSIVGAQHAALAVLLMVGISAFTVPTPDFGPVILTMPLWALILLHYWRAVGEGRRGYWVALAVEIGLLLLTTYAGLLLVGLLVLFTLPNQGRAALRSIDPWIAAVVAVIVMLPHLVWLADSGGGVLPVLARLRTPEAVAGNFVAWLRQLGLILAAHAGLIVLVALVAGWPWPRREAGAGDRARPGRAVRPAVHLFLRDRAGAGGDPHRRPDRRRGTGRRRCAPGRPFRPCGCDAGRRRHRAQPSACRDFGLVRAAAGAAGDGRPRCCCRRPGSASISTSTSRPRRWRASSPKAFSAAPAYRYGSSPAIRAPPR